jgi:alpha-glucosidase
VQNGDEQSVLSAYRSALELRKLHPALAVGSIRFLAADNDVLAFIRDDGSERLLAVFNFSQGGATWPVPPDVEVSAFLAGDATVNDPERLTLPALGYLLASIG